MAGCGDPLPGVLLIGGVAFGWWLIRSTWHDVRTMKDRRHKADAAARIRQMPPEQLHHERYEDLVTEEKRLCGLMQHRWADANTKQRLALLQAAIMQQLVGPTHSQPAVEQAPKPAKPALAPVPLTRRSTALAVVHRDHEAVRRT